MNLLLNKFTLLFLNHLHPLSCFRGESYEFLVDIVLRLYFFVSFKACIVVKGRNISVKESATDNTDNFRDF
jgi:hypothetical protein